MPKFDNAEDTTTLLQSNPKTKSLDEWLQFRYIGPTIERSLDPPSVAISKSTGLTLNMAMTQRLIKLHKKPKAVILFFDTETKEVGLWFAQSKESYKQAIPNTEQKIYSLTYYPRRIKDKTTGEVVIRGVSTVRISGGKGFVERYGLSTYINAVGKVSFQLKHCPEIDDGFYVTSLT